MALESLLQLLETLSQRIDEHGTALKRSETLTRYALIDPLLRELGWDTSDPAMVVPEYISPSGTADYAIFDGDNAAPLMVVAAKPLGESLQDATMPGIVHCFTEGIRYFAVTNGQAWDVYETHKPVPMEQKRVASFDLPSMTAAEARFQALAIWRPNMLDGKVTSAQSPATQRSIEKPAEAKPTQTPTYTSAEEKLRRAIFGDKHDGHAYTPEARDAAPSSAQTAETPSGNWVSLADLNPPPRGNPPAPNQIMFPDGSSATLGIWNKVIIETTRWLVANGYLNDGHCPIMGSSRGTRYIVSTTPIHSNDRPFDVERYIDGLYLELDYSGANLVKNAKTVINRAGQDPSQFKVRF